MYLICSDVRRRKDHRSNVCPQTSTELIVSVKMPLLQKFLDAHIRNLYGDIV